MLNGASESLIARPVVAVFAPPTEDIPIRWLKVDRQEYLVSAGVIGDHIDKAIGNHSGLCFSDDCFGVRWLFCEKDEGSRKSRSTKPEENPLVQTCLKRSNATPDDVGTVNSRRFYGKCP